jgi:aspartyl-tRNA(Asn)/glutamyl-tRNA(Gln) amidotransferase subunit C
LTVTKSDVLRLAQMVRIGLSDDEAEQLTRDMDGILAHVDKLQGVDTSSIREDHLPAADVRITRPDIVEPSLSVENVLANAPQRHEGFFVVPAVLAE